MPNIRCTACGNKWPLDIQPPICPDCKEPVEVEYARLAADKEDFDNNLPLLQKYQKVLPSGEIETPLSLGEGNTSLIQASRVSDTLNLDKIYFKNEALNPTGSFKDRGTVMGVKYAINSGVERIGTVSTGNMAASVAAYGAQAGLDCTILVRDSISDEQIAPIAVYGPRVIRVAGDYGKLYYDSLELGGRKDIVFINSDNPFRIEGQKTIAYEICQQLDWRVPDWIIVPLSSGGNLSAIIKGIQELKQMKLIDKTPRIVGVQAAGCSPIASAFARGDNEISREESPDTIAHAIGNPYPPSGNRVLRKMAEGVGTLMAVSEEEIIKAQQALAQKEGIFCQPASAVTLAAIRKLDGKGEFKSDQVAVGVITGNGLKDVDSVKRHGLPEFEEVDLENLAEII